MNSLLKSTGDLYPSELYYMRLFHDMGHGSLHDVHVVDGELQLAPSPTVVRKVKFGCARPVRKFPVSENFALKAEIREFFEYVRKLLSPKIKLLLVQDGLPHLMEVEISSGND